MIISSGKQNYGKEDNSIIGILNYEHDAINKLKEIGFIKKGYMD